MSARELACIVSWRLVAHLTWPWRLWHVSEGAHA